LLRGGGPVRLAAGRRAYQVAPAKYLGRGQLRGSEIDSLDLAQHAERIVTLGTAGAERSFLAGIPPPRRMAIVVIGVRTAYVAASVRRMPWNAKRLDYRRRAATQRDEDVFGADKSASCRRARAHFSPAKKSASATHTRSMTIGLNRSAVARPRNSMIWLKIGLPLISIRGWRGR